MNKPLTKLTKSGVKKLEAELENLKTVVRPEIAEKIKLARSFGDLSENSEYDEAKNEQGLIESRIAEIEQTLAHAIILDDDEISTEKVGIGNIVTILDIEMEEEMTSQHRQGSHVRRIPDRQGAHRSFRRRDCYCRGSLRRDTVQDTQHHQEGGRIK